MRELLIIPLYTWRTAYPTTGGSKFKAVVPSRFRGLLSGCPPFAQYFLKATFALRILLDIFQVASPVHSISSLHLHISNHPSSFLSILCKSPLHSKSASTISTMLRCLEQLVLKARLDSVQDDQSTALPREPPSTLPSTPKDLWVSLLSVHTDSSMHLIFFNLKFLEQFPLC